jgi:CubicO group peptidase (beta-lactamase class C family)
LLEVVSGKSLDALMREVVLEPLGLHDTVYWAHEAITKRVAIGHKASENGEPEVIAKWQLPRASQGDGSLVSSARDQMRYARFYMGQLGDDPINAASRLEMLVPHQTMMPETHVGLCWWIHDHLQSDGSAIHTVRHGGTVDGFLSEFWYLSEKNFAFTSLTNATSGAAFNKAISELVLEQFLDVPPAQLEPITLSSAQLERFVGWYSALDPNEGIDVTLTEHGLMLEVRMKSIDLEVPPTPLLPISESVLAGFEEPFVGMEVEFFGLEKSFGTLRASGRIFVRHERKLQP